MMQQSRSGPISGQNCHSETCRPPNVHSKPAHSDQDTEQHKRASQVREDAQWGGQGSPRQCSCLENPWTGEPGRYSPRARRVAHDWRDSARMHAYGGTLLSREKGRNAAVCSNVNGPRDYRSKWSKSDRERQIPYDITYTWNLKYDTNDLFTKQKQAHRHRKPTRGYQKGKGVGRDKLGTWD